MGEEIFRKESLDNVKSPDNLNEYVRVVNPGVWLLLAAIVILLLGACVWGIFGTIETVVAADITVSDGVIRCKIDGQSVEEGMIFRVNGKTYSVFSAVFDPETGFSECRADGAENLSDGKYSAVELVTERINPFVFVFN